VTVTTGRVVPAVEADASADPPRQLVQLHVEPAPPRVVVAVARCQQTKKNHDGLNNPWF
jgi:hypothetical protein